MILIVSDIHFGKNGGPTERDKEVELVVCLESFADTMDELILLGDVFEEYIEYRHLIPKGFTRFLGLLGRLSDRGVAISYFAGNHDPWHRDFFSSEFGARVIAGAETRALYGLRYHLCHGDGLSRMAAPVRMLRKLTRHRIALAAYTTLLPGDIGTSLARWVSRRFGSRGRSETTVRSLRDVADNLTARGDADVVVMGHSHEPECTPTTGGVYLNPGSWHYQRTFAVITSTGPELARWTSQGAISVGMRDATSSPEHAAHSST